MWNELKSMMFGLMGMSKGRPLPFIPNRRGKRGKSQGWRPPVYRGTPRRALKQIIKARMAMSYKTRSKDRIFKSWAGTHLMPPPWTI